MARDNEDDSMLNDFPLIESNRKTSLGERSQVLKNLPKSFRIGFIFVDVDDKTIRNQIADRCRVIRNDLS